MVDSLPAEGSAPSLLGRPHRGRNGDDEEGGARGCTANDDVHKDDDDSSSDDDDDDGANDDSDEEDEDDLRPALSLTEIREMKLKRNQAKLEELGLSNLMKRRRRSLSPTHGDGEDGQRGRSVRRGGRTRRRPWVHFEGPGGHPEDPNDNGRGGMLLPFVLDSAGPRRCGAASTSAAAPHLDPAPEQKLRKVNQLYDKYPHRHSQIRKLLGLLRPSSSHVEGVGAGLGDPRSDGGAKPPPIFVVGPRGTGKTSVVRDVLEALRHPDDSLVAAYVDCSALDAPTVGDVTRTLFRQLQHHVQKEEEAVATAAVTKSSNLRPGGDSWGGRRAEHRDMEPDVAAERQEAKTLQLDSLDGDENENTANGSDLGRLSNWMNVARSTEAPTQAFRSNDRVEGPPSPSDASAKPAGPAAVSKVPAATPSMSAPSHTAAAKFARNLRTLLDGTSRVRPRQVVLVLDQADKLLTLPRMGSAEPPNYLAQLMLVPRLIGVHVTVLAITTSNLLVHSRMHPLESTIAETFQPICIRFQNYKTKSLLMDIFRQEHMRAAVTGSASAPTLDFRRAAYDSFADTLVQSMQTMTTNVKEVSHLGQRLWPKYIEPLSSRESIVATLQQARQNLATSDCAPTRDSMQRELLLILGRLFRPVLIEATANCAYGILQPELQMPLISTPNQYLGLPSLAKYMLLSAYLCQVNRPERDTDLFSIESNGKRRRSNADSQHKDPEEMGEIASVPGTNLPRPRTFALERMISVYASVVGLATSSSADDDRCRALGGAAFYDNLSHLCDSGLLHEHPSQSGYETTRLNDPRYWTSISADDAKAMAKSLNFPLDSYIL